MEHKTFNLKSILLILLAVSVMLSFGTPVYAEGNTYVKNAVTATVSEAASLRKDASKKSKAIVKVKKGKKVTVTTFNGKWLYVKFKQNGKNYKGYLHLSKIKQNNNYLMKDSKLTIESGTNHWLRVMNLKGKTVNDSLEWSSTNTDVATVSQSGTISPQGIGFTQIYIVKNKKLHICDVTVVQAEAKKSTKYTVTKKSVMYKAANKKNKLTVVPKNSVVKYKGKSNKWTKIKYTNKKKKTFTGYIWSANIKKTTTRKTVKTENIYLKKIPKVLYEGHSVSLIAQLMPRNATQKIEWYTSNPNVVSVDERGVITYVSPGKAVITAVSGSAKAEANIETRAKGLLTKHADIPMTIGSSYKISRNTIFSLVKESDAVITSSNPAVADVSNGYINAKALGQTTITVVCSGYTDSFTVTVHKISKNAASPIITMFYTDTNYDVDAYNPTYVPLEQFANEKNDGHDGAYHPECLYFENGFGGYKYWLTYTPYPRNVEADYYDDGYENPCILASNDLVNWELPASNAINPIEPRPIDFKHGVIYNSDTDIVYNNDTKELECWWRFYDRPANKVQIFRKCSPDGVMWTNKELMLETPLKKVDNLSPSVIYENGIYKMWSIDQHKSYKVVYQEYNPNTKQWSERKYLEIEYSKPDMVSWHLGVTRTPKGYEMVLSAFEKNAKDHLHMDVYYCYSTDNENYTVADTMLKPTTGTENWDNMGIYRSSLMYADGKYYLFYPGINDKKGPMGIGIISGDDPFELK
ncbi:MAG: Ig-like domain-containing protein [Eubacterium sp.]|nr:Ig-like domain-containing protein [Eubacterium sp.]